jgi:hypothetical protein
VTAITAATLTGEAWKDIVIACSLLIGALIVLYVGLSYYRRNWLGGGDDASSTPWTLQDLRALREEGAITEEEYQKMRAAIIGAVRSQVTDPDHDEATPDNSETTEK